MAKKFFPILSVLFSLTVLPLNFCLAEDSVVIELFKYDLPISSYSPTRYTKCTVASMTVDGLRYYRTQLSSPDQAYPLLASANVNRGVLSENSFAYEDLIPELIDGNVVLIKYSTKYILNPNAEVTSVELLATDPNGKVIHHYVCREKLTS